VDSAAAIVAAIESTSSKPQRFLQASAVGFYGSQGEGFLEEDSPAGDGFLADVCRRTEAIASGGEAQGTKVTLLRTGLVLGRDGGILPRLMMPFRFFLGGYIGDGQQWLPWISLRDEARAIRFLLKDDGVAGPVNLVGPQPATMKECTRALGRALGRPAWTRVPAFAVRLATGEMADEMLLASMRARPKRLTEAGFTFEDPELETALRTIVQGEKE
jgi:hypothetical protein